MTARTLPADIETMRASGFLSLTWALDITSRYGQVLRYCGASRNAEIGGNTYTAIPGMSVSSIANTLGMNVDNCKSTLGDNGDIVQADVIDGLWDASAYRLFLYDHLDPPASFNDVVPWHYGRVANIEPIIGAFVIEKRDHRQALHQDQTPTHQEACTYELGGDRCKKDLTAFTFAAVAVTSVASAYSFTCSGLAQAEHYFRNGRLQFTTGDNANGVSSQIWRRIRAHAAGGVLTMQLPLVRAVQVGDLITIVAGCTHRFEEDCVDKFGNAINNGGCNTKPLLRELLEPGGG
jgi:uncharacterized phage protein (TIGR02218 family)